MERLGEFLKEKREERNISLEDISKKTRISVRNLKAIEAGDRKNLPSTTFLKGFVKAYIKCIGLDDVEVFTKFDYFTQHSEDNFNEIPEEIKGFFEKSKAKPYIYMMVLVLVIGLVSYAFLSEKKETKKVETPPVKETVPKEKEAESAAPFIMEESETVVIKETPEPEEEPPPKEPENEEPEKAPEVIEEEKVEPPPVNEPVEQPPAAKKKSFVIADKHHLVFRADGIVWMMVQVDDEEPYEVTLRAEEVYKLTANERFTVKIGDAGKVRVEFDGEELGYLGDEKQVKNITLPKPEE